MTLIIVIFLLFHKYFVPNRITSSKDCINIKKYTIFIISRNILYTPDLFFTISDREQANNFESCITIFN